MFALAVAPYFMLGFRGIRKLKPWTGATRRADCRKSRQSRQAARQDIGNGLGSSSGGANKLGPSCKAGNGLDVFHSLQEAYSAVVWWLKAQPVHRDCRVSFQFGWQSANYDCLDLRCILLPHGANVRCESPSILA